MSLKFKIFLVLTVIISYCRNSDAGGSIAKGGDLSVSHKWSVITDEECKTITLESMLGI